SGPHVGPHARAAMHRAHHASLTVFPAVPGVRCALSAERGSVARSAVMYLRAFLCSLAVLAGCASANVNGGADAAEDAADTTDAAEEEIDATTCARTPCDKIGRASCREREEIAGGAGASKTRE